MRSFICLLAIVVSAVSTVSSQTVVATGTIQPPVQKNVTWTIPGTRRIATTNVRGYGTFRKARPLVVLHGGPGIPSNYLTPLIDLAAVMPVYIYDQVGCGTSSHFADQNGNTTFWTEDLFVAEFRQVVKQLGIAPDFALFGHSWGGMLASRIASERLPGLRKLVLASTPATIPLWLESANLLRSQLPAKYRDALNKGDADGTTDSPEYLAAVQYFYDLHVIRVLPNPADVQASFAGLGEDPTVYYTMNGPNEFSISGPLKTWDGRAYAKRINVPTLLTNGKYDEGQDSAMQPWQDLIRGAKWVHFKNSSHMAMWEERSLYISTLRSFLV